MRRALFVCLIAVVVAGCASEEMFTPGEDDLCEYIDPAELTLIVGQAYSEYGAAPSPKPFEVSWDSDAYQGCAWESSDQDDNDSTVIGLILTEQVGWYEQWVEIDEFFHPHAGLSDGVRVGGGLGQPPIEVGRPGDWIPGIEIRLLVEGQGRTLEYWVGVPSGFEGDTESLLVIANVILELMGWLPPS